MHSDPSDHSPSPSPSTLDESFEADRESHEASSGPAHPSITPRHLEDDASSQSSSDLNRDSDRDSVISEGSPDAYDASGSSLEASPRASTSLFQLTDMSQLIAALDLADSTSVNATREPASHRFP